MKDHDWQIALFGTFDVENYGDLLFPLIAEAELAERLGNIRLHRFSYNARKPPEWPYAVASVTELPQMASTLDGALIGGGFIIRFDKDVAEAYGPPTPDIHHPTGYWLTPGLIALQHGIPLIWNAPGMHCNEIPHWAEPLMELALEDSSYITVRDALSQAALQRFVDKIQITVMPDTGFGVSRLLDAKGPSAAFNRLREASGLTDPYVIVQAIGGLGDFLCFVEAHAARLREFSFLVLPIGPVLGDRESIVGDDLPRVVRLSSWPHPLVVAELVSNAAAVVGQSYHLAITALACGVPVFTPADLSFGKYTALSCFETIFPLPKWTDDPDWFIARLGRTEPSRQVRLVLDQLSSHWDQIAAIIRRGSVGTQAAVNRFWQSLPNLLEAASLHSEMLEAEYRERRERCSAELNGLLDTARAEIAARDKRIAALHNSPSWRATAPLRFIMRNLKRLVGK